jgi:hypothetical protein
MQAPLEDAADVDRQMEINVGDQEEEEEKVDVAV